MKLERRSRGILLTALAASQLKDMLGLKPEKMSDKPEFTAEELEHVRSLPKKARQLAIEDLKAKYRQG